MFDLKRELKVTSDLCKVELLFQWLWSMLWKCGRIAAAAGVFPGEFLMCQPEGGSLLPRGVLAASSAPPDPTAALQSAQSLGKLRVQVLLLGILETSQDPVPSTGCTGISELSVPALYGNKHPPSLCSSWCGG